MLSPEDRLMSIPHCLVHSPKDTVGVVVVEGLKAGTDMLVLVTDNDTTLKLKARVTCQVKEAGSVQGYRAGSTNRTGAAFGKSSGTGNGIYRHIKS
jgi:(2R)-sulfolactate sulfo-lyase subunit alpha